MTATVRFRGIQPATTGPGGTDPINDLYLTHSVILAATLIRSAANTIEITQRLSDIKPLSLPDSLSLAQAADCQKIHHHEAASTLIFTTGNTVAGGQHGQPQAARVEEVFYVDGTILASNSVILQATPDRGNETVLVNGNQQTRGASEDYVIVGSTIVFHPTWVFELDDKITVKYLVT